MKFSPHWFYPACTNFKNWKISHGSEFFLYSLGRPEDPLKPFLNFPHDQWARENCSFISAYTWNTDSPFLPSPYPSLLPCSSLFTSFSLFSQVLWALLFLIAALEFSCEDLLHVKFICRSLTMTNTIWAPYIRTDQKSYMPESTGWYRLAHLKSSPPVLKMSMLLCIDLAF